MADSPNASKVLEYDTASNMEKHLHVGDLIEIDRGAFQHWSICFIDASTSPQAHVIHVTGDVASGFGAIIAHTRKSVADVRIEPFLQAVGSSKVRVNNTLDIMYEPYATGEEVIKRAISRLGEIQYDIMETNCEHFASWCRTGHEVSIQAATAKEKIEEMKMNVKERKPPKASKIAADMKKKLKEAKTKIEANDSFKELKAEILKKGPPNF